MEVSTSLSCLFLHEPLYQTTVGCYNSSIHHGSLSIYHLAILEVRVGLTQAHPNNCVNYTGVIIFKCVLICTGFNISSIAADRNHHIA